MTIKEIAARTGVSADTLRYYAHGHYTRRTAYQRRRAQL